MKFSRRDILKSFLGVVAGTVVLKEAAPARAMTVEAPRYEQPSVCIITIFDEDITKASCDLLEQKYQDGLDQILAQEDQIFLDIVRHGIHT